MRHLLAAAAILALATPLAAQESDAMTSQATQNADLTIERVFASPGLDGPSPRQAKLSADGRYLTLLRNRADDRERYDL